MHHKHSCSATKTSCLLPTVPQTAPLILLSTLSINIQWNCSNYGCLCRSTQWMVAMLYMWVLLFAYPYTQWMVAMFWALLCACPHNGWSQCFGSSFIELAFLYNMYHYGTFRWGILCCIICVTVLHMYYMWLITSTHSGAYTLPWVWGYTGTVQRSQSQIILWNFVPFRCTCVAA